MIKKRIAIVLILIATCLLSAWTMESWLQDKNSKMIYINEKIGLKFEYPKDWHISSDDDNSWTESGELIQMFNYNEKAVVGGSIFPKGYDKIIASLIDGSYPDEPSFEYPEKNRTITWLKINGQEATRVDVDHGENRRGRQYIIQLPSRTEKHLNIGIYGDSRNFYVLEDLVNSIEWLK